MKTKLLNIFARGKQILARGKQAIAGGKDILARFQQIIVRNRRTFMLAVLLVAVVLLIVPHLALAAESNPSSPDLDEMYKNITKLVTFTMEFLQRLIWPVLLLIGGLMKTDILFGSGMEDRMLAIWVQIRNLVNILFVLVLLGIAFYNVVGGSNQAYQLKGMLPKFVIGLIAVNFSFIGVKLLIDTVNVMTTAVFALPAAVQDGLGKNPVDNKDFVNRICEGIYGSDPSEYQKSVTADKNALCKTDKQFVPKAQAFFANFDANNAGIVMAINLSNISDWGKVSPGVKDFKSLALGTVFSVTLFIVFATAFVALFVVLLVRLVVLWVTLVLSPLIVLTYVLPEGISSSVGGGDLKKKFVKNIIAPLPIALMMTIGFLMLQGMKTGSFTSLSNLTMNVSSISMGMFASGLSTLQELIIAVGTIAVIWMGVFEAASGTYADGIVKQIKSGVEGVGKFAATSLKYAPMFPVSGAKDSKGNPLKMSFAGAMRMGQALESNRSEQAGSEAAAAIKGLGLSKGQGFSDAIRGSKTQKDWRQNVRNAKGLEDTEGIQKSMGFGAKNVPGLQQSLIIVPNMKDTKGKSITRYSELIASLDKGDVEADSMQRFVNENTKGLDAEPPKTQADADKAKKGAPSTKEDHDRAKTVLDMAGTNEKMLTPEQKAAAGNYRAAMARNDDKKKEAALKALQAEGPGSTPSALQALEKNADDRDKFRIAAGQAKDGKALDVVIESRRKELTDKKVAAADQNGILRNELGDLITGNSDAVQKSTQVPGIKAASPATTPSPVAAYVEPAGKAKGGGGPKPSNIKFDAPKFSKPQFTLPPPGGNKPPSTPAF